MDFALCAPGNLTRDEVHELVVNREDYVMETKHDGIRAMLVKDGTKVTITTRSGQVLNLPHIEDMASRYGFPKLILDGELILPGKSFRELQSTAVSSTFAKLGVVFVAFDILGGPVKSDYVNQNYLLRHTMMLDACHRISGTCIQLVTQYTDPGTAMDYYDLSKKHNWDEGFVLKKKSGLYTPGRSLNWLRSKFKSTISVMPLDVGDDGKVMCSMWTGDGSQQVHVATVQVPPDDLILLLTQDLNMVVELEAYGVDARTNKLRHPTYKGCRFDVDMLSCTADQLESLRSF